MTALGNPPWPPDASWRHKTRACTSTTQQHHHSQQQRNINNTIDNTINTTQESWRAKSAWSRWPPPPPPPPTPPPGLASRSLRSGPAMATSSVRQVPALGGYTGFRSHSNTNLLIRPARSSVRPTAATASARSATAGSWRRGSASRRSSAWSARTSEHLTPGGCTAFRSDSNRNMLSHPARGPQGLRCDSLRAGRQAAARPSRPRRCSACFDPGGYTASVAIPIATCFPTRLKERLSLSRVVTLLPQPFQQQPADAPGTGAGPPAVRRAQAAQVHHPARVAD